MKDGSFKEDQAGIKVLSRLNEQVLRDLADKTRAVGPTSPETMGCSIRRR
jgi:hypothetical protein